MYVSVPDSLSHRGKIRRGVVEPTIVESIDLMPTLADLTDITLPHQALAGETLSSLLLDQTDSVSTDTDVLSNTDTGVGARKKKVALSQWPRRPSCTTKHSCMDGHGDPFQKAPDVAVMGYTMRTDEWRYTAWFEYDWSRTTPVWQKVQVSRLCCSDLSICHANVCLNWDCDKSLSGAQARELYDHKGDIGDMQSGENGEFNNLAHDPNMAAVVSQLHQQLVALVNQSLVSPLDHDPVYNFKWMNCCGNAIDLFVRMANPKPTLWNTFLNVVVYSVSL